jgi:hypothetical protein
MRVDDKSNIVRLSTLSGPASTVAQAFEKFETEPIVTILLRGPIGETTALAEAIQRFGPLESLFMKQREMHLDPSARTVSFTELKTESPKATTQQQLNDWQWD